MIPFSFFFLFHFVLLHYSLWEKTFQGLLTFCVHIENNLIIEIHNF